MKKLFKALELLGFKPKNIDRNASNFNRLLQLLCLKPKKLDYYAVDAQGNPIGKYSMALNNNDPIIYSTPKMTLEGLYIRGNPDGSEDLVKRSPEGYAFVKNLCGPGQGKYDYLITKESRQGKYEYLEIAERAKNIT